MNGGVSSRGSPTPKSITGTPRSTSRRLASVSRTNGYVRRPVRTGGGFLPPPSGRGGAPAATRPAAPAGRGRGVAAEHLRREALQDAVAAHERLDGHGLLAG